MVWSNRALCVSSSSFFPTILDDCQLEHYQEEDIENLLVGSSVQTMRQCAGKPVWFTEVWSKVQATVGEESSTSPRERWWRKCAVTEPGAVVVLLRSCWLRCSVLTLSATMLPEAHGCCSVDVVSSSNPNRNYLWDNDLLEKTNHKDYIYLCLCVFFFFLRFSRFLYRLMFQRQMFGILS